MENQTSAIRRVLFPLSEMEHRKNTAPCCRSRRSTEWRILTPSSTNAVTWHACRRVRTIDSPDDTKNHIHDRRRADGGRNTQGNPPVPVRCLIQLDWDQHTGNQDSGSNADCQKPLRLQATVFEVSGLLELADGRIGSDVSDGVAYRVGGVDANLELHRLIQLIHRKLF